MVSDAKQNDEQNQTIRNQEVNSGEIVYHKK